MPYLSESINEPSFESDASGNAISPALRCALSALETGDFHTRWEAAKTISACGLEAIQGGFPEQVIDPLLNLLQADDSEEVSWYIARILGAFDHPLAVKGLTNLLQASQSPDVTAMAATALANCGTAAIPPLTGLLHQPETKLLAIRALAQIDHPDVVPILLPLTSDSLAKVRSAAIDALSRFTHSAILDALLGALRDPDSSVRRSAVVALGFQAQSLHANLTHTHVNAEQPASWKDDALDHSLVNALKPLLWDIDLDVCSQTALTLGRIGSSNAISELGKVLQSPNTPTQLQQAIVRAIGWLEIPEAISRLQEALFNSAVLASESQLEIITVLGRLRPTESILFAVQILLDLLHAQHPISKTSKGKQTIAHSFGQLAVALTNDTSGDLEFNREQLDKMINALISFLEDPDAGVRLHVIAALRAFDDSLVHSKLIALIQDETTSNHLCEGIKLALMEQKRSNK